MLAATTTAGVALAATTSADAASRKPHAPRHYVDFVPGRGGDETSRLQDAINHAATLRRPIALAPGTYRVSGKVHLRPATKLIGAHGLTVLALHGQGAIVANNSADVRLEGLSISGRANTRAARNDALLAFNHCDNLVIADVALDSAPSIAVQLWHCSGRIERCHFTDIAHTAILSGNATSGIDISHNRIRRAGNNGIVIWRETAGSDASLVVNNDIAQIRTNAGGSGQNGNAINVFRADHVLVSNNTIADCAYSAVRCNSASNAQVIANNCRDIGEVALYAEFGFEGAVIANNLVERAATGISVTNFNEGGRLATVQGNLVRNLFRREHEPVDKRGVGIAVEADTVVSANTIEQAPTAGIEIGYGRFMRHVAASGNLIRQAGIGIAISRNIKSAGILVTNNIISATQRGGIRLLDHDRPVGPALEDAAHDPSAATLSGNLIS